MMIVILSMGNATILCTKEVDMFEILFGGMILLWASLIIYIFYGID